VCTARQVMIGTKASSRLLQAGAGGCSCRIGNIAIHCTWYELSTTPMSICAARPGDRSESGTSPPPPLPSPPPTPPPSPPPTPPPPPGVAASKAGPAFGGLCCSKEGSALSAPLHRRSRVGAWREEQVGGSIHHRPHRRKPLPPRQHCLQQHTPDNHVRTRITCTAGTASRQSRLT
jgi:hypothetical protein